MALLTCHASRPSSRQEAIQRLGRGPRAPPAPPPRDRVSQVPAPVYPIQRGDFDVVIAPAATALVRLCPPSYLAAYTFFLHQGERLDREALRRQLALRGHS